MTTGITNGRARSGALGVARWAVFGASCVLFAWALRDADLVRSMGAITRVGPLVVVGLLPFCVAIALDVAGWRVVFTALSQPVPHLGLLRVRLATEAVLMSLPGGALVAETLSPALLAERCGVPMPIGFASLGAKKSLFSLAHGLYIVIGGAIGFGTLAAISRSILGRPGLPWIIVGSGLAAAVAASLTLAAFLYGGVGAWAHRALHRLAFFEGARAYLAERRPAFLETDRQLARLSTASHARLFSSLALFFGSWLVETLETLLFLRLLRVERLGLVDVMSFEAAVSLLRSLAFFVPSGLGVQDVSYLAFFRAFGVADPATTGAAFVILKRAKEIVFIAVGYALLLTSGHRPTWARSHDASVAPSS